MSQESFCGQHRPLLLVWGCEVNQILCPACRGCSGKCLPVALRFYLLGLSAEKLQHLELTWSCQEQERGNVARRRRWNCLTKGRDVLWPKRRDAQGVG